MKMERCCFSLMIKQRRKRFLWSSNRITDRQTNWTHVQSLILIVRQRSIIDNNLTTRNNNGWCICKSNIEILGNRIEREWIKCCFYNPLLLLPEHTHTYRSMLSDLQKKKKVLLFSPFLFIKVRYDDHWNRTREKRKKRKRKSLSSILTSLFLSFHQRNTYHH